MTSEEKTAIDACKDQAAQKLSKGFWQRWDDFIHDARNRADWIKKFNEYSDRAMQLYGEQCRKNEVQEIRIQARIFRSEDKSLSDFIEYLEKLTHAPAVTGR
jgi:hypothetical protein